MIDYYKFKVRKRNINYKRVAGSGQRVAGSCWLSAISYRLIAIVFLFTFYLSPFTSQAQWLSGIKDSWAEKWRTHAEADPFTISGTIGASLNSSWNNRDVLGATSPFSTAAYADFISVDGGDFTDIGTFRAGEDSFSDNSAPAGTRCTYYIELHLPRGVISSPSNQVTVKAK